MTVSKYYSTGGQEGLIIELIPKELFEHKLNPSKHRYLDN